MTSNSITEPIALARRARHRKPNRRRNILKGAAGILASVAAIGGTMAFAPSQPGAQTFYGLTAQQAIQVAVAASPQGCKIAGGTMRYGDAGLFGGRIEICTEDGTLKGDPSWDHLKHECHVTRACTYVPADVRRDLGIHDEIAVMTVGDTSHVYVLTGHGMEVDES